jgi:hypothetical protein
VVLVVIAHVQRQTIDRAVIAKGFLVEIVRVMLLNPARADGVQSNRKQKGKHEIKKSGPAEEINYRDIVQDRAYQIGGEPAVPHFDGFQSRRPRYLKEWKKH